MIPETVSIVPPEWDWIAAYGIGGMAVVIATAWVVLFSLGSGRRALVISLITVVIMFEAPFVWLWEDHVMGPLVAIGKGTKDPWPKPEQLLLEDFVTENSLLRTE